MILNLRELACGFTNEQGIRIKKNMLFRSSYPVQNEENIKVLTEYEISSIFDLRNKNEIEKAPSFKKIKTEVYPIGGDFETVQKEGDDKKVEFKFAAKYMEDFYATNLVESEKLKELMRDIIDNPRTILYHCTAGKDRTGIVSIVLMKIFGFSMEDIYTEYLTLDEKLVDHLRQKIPKEIIFDDEKDLEAVLGVKREYIDAYFNKIDNKYGNYENYLREYLEITLEDEVSLKDYYLE